MIADTFGLDKTLVKKASFKEFITKHPQKRPRQKNLKLSNRKLLKELGIRMSAIDEGLRECARQINS